MKLNDIFKGIKYELIKGTMDETIIDITYDSRKVRNGTLFLADYGIRENNSKYIQNAIQNGANVIVISNDIDIKENVTIIKVENTSRSLAYLSMNFFDNPQSKLTTIAITGTKGKTTTSFMLKSILENAGYKCGLIGTIGIYIGTIKYPTNNTTPSSYDILKYLSEMVKNKVKYAIIEVSSQALKYGRVEGIFFNYGIFTNLSKDHIGPYEHDNMEDYILSKSLLFRKCQYGIFNLDDEYYQDVVKNSIASINTYGFHQNANLRVKKIKFVHKKNYLGIQLITDGLVKDKFIVSSPGYFTASNALATILTCYLLNIDIKYVKKALKNFSVSGRVEPIKIRKNITLLIDYAHNGLSTKSILTTIRKYHPKRIITIFGCGGNRSPERRYEMGEMAGTYSDFCLITEDNNRYESFDNIAKDILIGMNKTNCPYEIIPKREHAIEYAIKNARKGDIIVLLGKGHENYLEINGIKYPFNEKTIIEKILKKNKLSN